MEACKSKKTYGRLPCKSHEEATFTVYELLYLTDGRNDQRTGTPSVFRWAVCKTQSITKIRDQRYDEVSRKIQKALYHYKCQVFKMGNIF